MIIQKSTFVHIICLAFIIFVIYANTLNAPFQWDEKVFIADNPVVKGLHYFAHPSGARGFEYYDSFIRRYIGYLTFALNYKLHGFSVPGYHIVNIVIHTANSILVYFLVLLTLRARGRVFFYDSGFIAFFSALLFAVHPLQTEAVTYVFQRFASLAAMFYLFSLVAYIKARLMGRDYYPSPNPLPPGEREKAETNTLPLYRGEGARGRVSSTAGFIFYSISFISAVLAMKTKENAFTLPFVIALYEFCFFSGSIKKRMLYLTPFLLTLLIIPLTLMSLTGSHHLDPGSYGARQFSRGDYLFTQFRVIATYLRLLFSPVGQNLCYDYPVYHSFFERPVLLSFSLLATLFGLGTYLVTRKTKPQRQGRADISAAPEARRFNAERSTQYAVRFIGFGILWFFVTLSVESSIIPIPMLINEYRMYLPSVGIIISVVAGIFLLTNEVECGPPKETFSICAVYPDHRCHVHCNIRAK